MKKVLITSNGRVSVVRQGLMNVVFIRPDERFFSPELQSRYKMFEMRLWFKNRARQVVAFHHYDEKWADDLLLQAVKAMPQVMRSRDMIF